MAGVNLDMGKLDGSTVNEKDFRKLYFVYLSSKTEDWNFILETRGLRKHIDLFSVPEPLHCEYFGTLILPEIDIDQMDHAFDIKRDSKEAGERAARNRSVLEPENVEIDGLPKHLTMEQFKEVLDVVLPTWIEFRRHSIAPRQNFKDAAKLAMYADLLEAKSIAASADLLLASVRAASTPAKVFASVEKGSVSGAAARAYQRVDGEIAYIEPNKLPFRILDVYNGPVLSARIEERSGYVGMAGNGSSEPTQPADGLACEYVKGVIFDQYSQKGILDAIKTSRSYPQLLKLLLTCGFDLGISNADPNPRRANGRCWRIMQGNLVMGALFDYSGGFGCLRWQPSVTDFRQEWGMCCIYRDDTNDVFITCWQLFQLCTSIRHYRSCLFDANIHTVPVLYTANFVI